ncbi:MAG: hypothetical protein ACPGWR_09330 [Ardenticatenaceae bacterium]
MSRVDLLPKMWQRAGMYLFDYVRTDGASMYAAFIHAVYEMSERSERPKRVRFQAQGEYHVMIAEDYQIGLNSIGSDHLSGDSSLCSRAGFEQQPSVIDWLSNQGVALADQPQNPLQSCIGLANIVSFTEFCALDLSVANEHFRQLFYLGQAASPSERRQKSDLPNHAPFVALWFTLHPAVFKSRTVCVEQVEQALQRLQEYVAKEFRITCQERYDYGFAMTIELAENLSEKVNGYSAADVTQEPMVAIPA